MAAHIEVMSAAREHGDLRTVQGHAYPVPPQEMARWEEQQKAARAEQVKRFLRTRFGRRLTAECAFS
jgi:hypothetical protein